MCDDTSYSPKDKKVNNPMQVRSFLCRRALLLAIPLVLTAGLLLWVVGGVPHNHNHLKKLATSLRKKSSSTSTTVSGSSDGDSSTQTRKATATAISSLPRLLDTTTNGSNEMSLEEKATLFSGKRIALYFAAGWCPMCRRFENPLQDWIQEQSEIYDTQFQLIYVPSDLDPESAIERATKFNMPLVPFGDEADKLKQQYKIWAGKESSKFGKQAARTRRAGVPSIVILDSRTGDELKFLPTEAKGVNALEAWPLGDDDEANAIW